MDKIHQLIQNQIDSGIATNSSGVFTLDFQSKLEHIQYATIESAEKQFEESLSEMINLHQQIVDNLNRLAYKDNYASDKLPLANWRLEQFRKFELKSSKLRVTHPETGERKFVMFKP